MNRAFLLATLLSPVALAGVISAQTFQGDYLLSVSGQPTQQGPLAGGCVEESMSLVGHPTLGDCGVVAYAAATIERVAEQGALASAVTVDAAQLYPRGACGAGAGAWSYLQQRITADDVVFRDTTDPSATDTVPVSLNVDYSGTHDLAEGGCGGWASLSFQVSVGGSSSLYCQSDDFGVWTAPMTGYPNDGSTVSVATPEYQATLGQPVQVSLYLHQTWLASWCESDHPGAIHGEGSARLACATSGPVFDVPPGITVDSAELHIADNRWIGMGVSFLVQPDDATVLPGNDATFSVVPDGPYLSLRWRKDGVDLTDGPTGTGSTVVGADTPYLFLQNVSLADAGLYSCFADTDCVGETSSEARLRVRSLLPIRRLR